MKYPIGIQNFERLRREGYTYVDKTALVHKLVSEGSYYFLSRPRRFGKSLLLSTFEAYFQGKKELFEGLAIAETETEWAKYPVLHLDLNTEKYETKQSLDNILDSYLKDWETIYQPDIQGETLSDRFMRVIRQACQQTGRQVVILVDEYDKPLLQAIGNEPLQNEYRSTLKAFYGALKSCDRYIRFAFLTGVTKFGKVSVFSDLNNLTDLSLDKRYSTICGITEQELHDYFDDSVLALARENGIEKEACYERLKFDYDGYHFSIGSAGVYNPFSLLNTLSSRQFKDYWFETGTPSFLVYQLMKSDYQLDYLTEEELTADTLNSIDVMDDNPLPLLYQSGYLTLKDYDPKYRTYRLEFPNREVREGFIKYLVPYYTPKHRDKSSYFIRNFVKEMESGDAEGFMRRLDSFFSKGDYQLMGDKEVYFHNAIYVFFTLLGFYVEVERHTTDGRMDILAQTPDFIYIFELKINQSAEAALQQIESKGYAKPFAADPRQLFKIGVNFSTETRTIDDWKVNS